MTHPLLNWKRDYHDASDPYVHLHEGFKLTATTLPTGCDLRGYCSPVFDQGQIGSCTGNALIGALEYLENKIHDFEVNKQFTQLSRLFVYYNERVIEGSVPYDAGAQISDGVKTLATIGACSESVWPYLTYRFATTPNKKAYADAATRKITSYARVSRDNGIGDIKTTLASGYPIVFGFTVYDSFMTDTMAKTGVLNMPKAKESVQGGHAVLMVGYNELEKRVLVRNSWGPAWGQKGYFTMPYDYVMDRNLASDFWTITK